MSKTLEIGGRTVSIGTLSATDARSIQLKIISALGAPLIGAISGGGGGVEGGGGMALAGLASNIKEDDLDKIMATVFKCVTIDGERVNLDKHFTGRVMDMWDVLYAALMENFGGFLAEIRSRFERKSTPVLN